MATPEQKQQFLNLCAQANTRVDLAERRFAAWLSSIAIAYGTAWNRHTNLLKEIDTQLKLEQALVINAALAFIPGGIGGHVGTAMKKLDAGDFLVDGVKDLAKWGMRSGAVVGLEGGVGPGGHSAMKAFPKDPLQWQNEINVRVQTEMANITANIERWQNKVNSGDPNFELNFNPLDGINGVLQLQPPALTNIDPFIRKKIEDVMKTAEQRDNSPSSTARGAFKGFEWPKLTWSPQPKVSLVELRPVNWAELQITFEKGFLFYWTLVHYFAVRIQAWGFSSLDKMLDRYADSLGMKHFQGFRFACDSVDYSRHNQGMRRPRL